MAYKEAACYPHRRKKDGSLESICLKCFMTVATSRSEDELMQLEKKHVCVSSPLTQRGSSPSKSS